MKTLDVYNIYSLKIAAAEGAYIFDKNNQRYLDLYGGHGVISVGHTHPHYVEAIYQQLQKIGFYSNSVEIEIQAQLAEKLGNVSSCNDYQLFLCNSGAEANENALKVASFHTGKKKVIAFNGSFHGRTGLALSVTNNPAIAPPMVNTEITTFIDFEAIEELEQLLSKKDVAAVIIEGIQGVGGVKSAKAETLVKIEALCKQYGALLILDEIQCGYGRTGDFFAFQNTTVQPDIITTAKGMGNGFPVAGVLIHNSIQLHKGALGTTFGGNPLACAAALAVLEIMDNEQLMSNAKAQGAYLLEQLQTITAIKQIRGRGLMWGLDFDFNIKELRKKLLFDHHVFTGISGTHTLRLLPPLGIQKQEIDLFISALKAAL